MKIEDDELRRLECLRLAAGLSASPTAEDVVAGAQKYFDFLKGSDQKPVPALKVA